MEHPLLPARYRRGYSAGSGGAPTETGPQGTGAGDGGGEAPTEARPQGPAAQEDIRTLLGAGNASVLATAAEGLPLATAAASKPLHDNSRSTGEATAMATAANDGPNDDGKKTGHMKTIGDDSGPQGPAAADNAAQEEIKPLLGACKTPADPTSAATNLYIFGSIFASVLILVMIGGCFLVATRSTGSQETKMPKIKVEFYGVLGDREENRPDSHTAIVDPAGLRFIADNRPGEAGGASGAIYSALRIKEFPQHVRDRITRATEAAIHHYDDFDVIHVVGPQLWQEVGDVIHDVTQEAACGLLVQSYRNVFQEFGSKHSLRYDLDELRLLPISGGIFAGRYKQQLPTMSATAVYQALSDLKRDDNQVIDRLKQTTIKMCIFDKAEQEDYRKAFDDSNNDGRYSCVISAATGQDRVVQV